MKDAIRHHTTNERLEKLGFKCGLEIHQQLNTKRKLFCHCPVGSSHGPHNAELLRHMRPTLSELGEYDGTALMEFKTKKNVIYRLYRDLTCTYEMDDTPPFLVNQQAVDFAIQLALHFNCRIVDELHVIRKQYLDGSIPTGFQRTMIIGVDGWMPFKDRTINITQVNLEEEACREISDIGHYITFATDRLSIPLVEIITDAQMKNPDEAAAVCRLLGNSMKITGLVRRGIGTVRQDVNVSVTGGKRVEIKGVHKVENIRSLTASEALRQKGLLELQKIYTERFPKPDDIEYTEGIFTDLFRDNNDILGRRLESDRPLKVIGLRLPELADITTKELQPVRDFAFELSGRVRVIACIDTIPNLFFLSHADQYDITASDWDKIKTKLGWTDGDDIVLICGPSDDVLTAINEIKIRISELAEGVVHETRQDIKDGTSDFERILPGPDRMYPDTDHPPVRITDERVENIRSKLTEPLWEKQSRWAAMGLHKEQIGALSLSPFSGLFDRLCSDNRIDQSQYKKIAHICTSVMVALRRAGHDLRTADKDALFNIIKTAVTSDWPYNHLKAALISLANGEPGRDGDRPLSEQAVEKLWQSAKSEFHANGNPENDLKFRRFVTGKILEFCSSDTHKVLTQIESKFNS